jgi:phosphoribosylaminoimidazolecarboxamide formyltransferase/IMP cyclohydrolase
METTPPIKRALLSVWDKREVVDIARMLHECGIELLSTGGTAVTLRQAGLPVTLVETCTGFPEILDGRVKTLHPAIHAAILARRDDPSHCEQLRTHRIEPIDLVYVNLYPFPEASESTNDEQSLLEMIDIGGPTLVRAAAKNYQWVVPIVHPEDCRKVIEQLRASGSITLEERRHLAARAFQYTAWYDSQIAHYFAPSPTEHEYLTLGQAPKLPLRYGENPHQDAALFGPFKTCFTHLHGKELSFNNLLDLDAAVRLVMEFTDPTVAIVKHTNPCGVGSDASLHNAWEKAYATDTVSPFGGIVAVNRPIDEDFATHIHPLFTEVIVAPAFSDAALSILTKKRDRRLVTYDRSAIEIHLRSTVLRSVIGGILVQTADSELFHSDRLRIVTEREPNDQELQAMMFAWKVAKHAKSNAIVFAAPDRTLAIGAGQPSRVDSARIASWKAAQFGINLHGSAVASDAFFPFADGVIQCADAGATAIIQPGGSIRDEDVIRAANDRNLAMIFTDMRHFRH